MTSITNTQGLSIDPVACFLKLFLNLSLGHNIDQYFINVLSMVKIKDILYRIKRSIHIHLHIELY